jgi:hypothetical protein
MNRNPALFVAAAMATGASFTIESAFAADAENEQAMGFIYLSTEAPLVPGQAGSTTSCYISERGVIQHCRISGDIVDEVTELTDRTSPIFDELTPVSSGTHFTVASRSDTVEGADGIYPEYERLFFRRYETSRAIYCGLVKDAPEPVTRSARSVHQFCETKGATALRAPLFLRASVLDEDTARRFREQHLLHELPAGDLSSAPRTTAALREPFRLIACSDTELRTDNVAGKLNDRQPVTDVLYHGVAFQLRLMKAATSR